jgi:hypothetical protein
VVQAEQQVALQLLLQVQLQLQHAQSAGHRRHQVRVIACARLQVSEEQGTLLMIYMTLIGLFRVPGTLKQ